MGSLGELAEPPPGALHEREALDLASRALAAMTKAAKRLGDAFEPFVPAATRKVNVLKQILASSDTNIAQVMAASIH